MLKTHTKEPIRDATATIRQHVGVREAFSARYQRQQSTDSHTTRRTAALTTKTICAVENVPTYQLQRTASNSCDARRRPYVKEDITTGHCRSAHNEHQQEHEKKTPIPRTSRPKRTTRRLITTTAPGRAPKATLCQDRKVTRREEEESTYRTAHGDEPISSTTKPQPTTRAHDNRLNAKDGSPPNALRLDTRKRRHGRRVDGPEKHALADKRPQDPRTHPRVERSQRQPLGLCHDQRDLEKTKS